jgi:endoglucanase
MKNNTHYTCMFLFVGLLAITMATAQQPVIHLNQIGFYPNGPKRAVLVFPNDCKKFEVKTEKGETVFSGKVSKAIVNPYSKKPQAILNFSALKIIGSYYLVTDKGLPSYTFSINNNIHNEVTKAAIKGYYYQRCSKELTAEYATKWARPPGHADDVVYVHASAATDKRPEGTVISCPKGWYDAGDYNKYIINSGISTATLMSLYEDFEAYASSLTLNIPEEHNELPDLLDEVLWNLDWMRTMQDPNDGGVYHKLTNENFDALNVMPHLATTKRYVIAKNTTATLDFAATMAQAYRIFKPFHKQRPGLADSCLAAAKYAWQWCINNPNIVYNQQEHNKNFKPAIYTGAYGDTSCKDEWIWAAAELYASTGNEMYTKQVNIFPDEKYSIAFWSNMRMLAYYTLLRMEKTLVLNTQITTNKLQVMKQHLLKLASSYVTKLGQQPFYTIMGKNPKDWSWGSTAVAANQAILMLYAYKIKPTATIFLHAAIDNVDLLMGRNATGYNFLTGFGSKQVMNIHHRPSVADGVKEPVPGLLSGGPNPKMQDKCEGYPSTFADECFLDHECSYASNEICLNWNAPLVYILGAIEALQKKL